MSDEELPEGYVAKHSPKFAPHVVGFVPKIEMEDGKLEPKIVRMLCQKCGVRHQVKCNTGAYRQWVDKFATVHLHRDVLNDPFPPQRR